MGRKKLVIEIEFDEVQDEYDEGYTFLEFAHMKIDPEHTGLSRDELDGLAEAWGQSDWYSVGFCSAFISMLDGNEINASDVKSY